MALNILLLEDDEAFAHVLSRAMKKRGHQLSWVPDAESLLVTLQQGVEQDLILMDLKLAEGTSLNLVDKVRERFPFSKIFMVTGYASIATTVEAMKRGADDYLPKPVTADDILKCYFANEGGEADMPVNVEPLSPKRLEWEHIQRVLQEHDGNISRTAKALNMHRRTLQRKLQKKPNQQ